MFMERNILLQAVTSLGEDYRQSVITVQFEAAECLKSVQAPVFLLPDNSHRQTWAGDSNGSGQYPPCLRSALATVARVWTQLDNTVSRLIMTMAGEGDTDWSDQAGTAGDYSTVHYKV